MHGRQKTPAQRSQIEQALDYLRVSRNRLKDVGEPAALMRLNALIGDLEMALGVGEKVPSDVGVVRA